MSTNTDKTNSPQSTMWRNFGFIGFLLFGVLGLSVFLMSTDRIEPPRSFAPNGQTANSIRQVAANVDRAFQDDWQELGITELADRAPTLTIVRRLGVGIAGSIPSVQEIREIEKQKPENQIDWWVSRLLEDRRTSNYLAERMARAVVGVDDGPFVVYRRRRFVKWLSDQLHENQSYDRIVTSLITDEGLWTDTPSVNFYTATMVEDTGRPDPIHLAGRTSRAFLGMRIDCLQCHDDFLGTIDLVSSDKPESGLQTDFHSLAAFFSETNASLLGIRNDTQPRDYEYQLLDEEDESVIKPQVPFLRELDNGQGSRRDRLANWVTHKKNRPFARAAVNRVWAIVCGQPLVEPVDDIPINGPFPRALEVLASDLVEHDFDLQRLIRCIVHTRAFQTASTADFKITPKLENNWAVFPMVRLRPDQVAGSIVQSTSLTTIDSTAHIMSQLIGVGEKMDFVRRYGDPGEDEFVERGETVTQRLLMLNGKMIRERLQNPLTSVVSMAGLAPDSETAVQTVYLSVLARAPTEAEQQHFVGQLEGLSGDERSKKIQDLYWVLINSVEFAWNH